MIEHPRSQEHKTTVESHFGFRETPFGVTSDPRFFYDHPHYAEGLAVLIHGIETKKGFMLVTGEVGTGKTILLRKLMRHFEGRVQFVFVSNSHLTSYGLTELMVQSLGLASEEKNRLDMIQDINGYLIAQLESGRTVALLIDEAQKLSDGNGRDAVLDRPQETRTMPLGDAERMAISPIATERHQVSTQFFDRMARAATEAMGPMAQHILVDQISALGESRETFPQEKLAELIFRMSDEILNETLRYRFQQVMFDEIFAQKTM